jgi:hypothetical protein
MLLGHLPVHLQELHGLDGKPPALETGQNLSHQPACHRFGLYQNKSLLQFSSQKFAFSSIDAP